MNRLAMTLPAAFVALTFSTGCPPPCPAPCDNQIERASVDTAEIEGNGGSHDADVSDDGRFVVFTSWATNLIGGDGNGVPDVFCRDRGLGATERVSEALGGGDPDDMSGEAAIGSDGRYVAFASRATNLVVGDTNRNGAFGTDIFVRDRQLGATVRVSVATDGTEMGPAAFGTPTSGNPAITPDGRFVSFWAAATELHPTATHGVYVRDRDTDGDAVFDEPGEVATTLVSVDSTGTPADDRSWESALSDDGRYVAFTSDGANLVPDDLNGVRDAFVHDRATGATVRVSVASDGTEGNDHTLDVSISADGRYVAMMSDATNLVMGPQGGGPLHRQIFVHDRDADGDGVFDEPGETATTLESLATGGAPASRDSFGPRLSADGRFLAFTSDAGNLVATNLTLLFDDAYVRDRTTGVTTLVSWGEQGPDVSDAGGYADAISADGRFVAFTSNWDNLVAGDTNIADDVFVQDRGAP